MAEIAHIRNINGSYVEIERYALDANGKAKGRVQCADGAVFMPPQVGQTRGPDSVVPVVASVTDNSVTQYTKAVRISTPTAMQVTDQTTVTDVPVAEVRQAMPALSPRQIRLALVQNGFSLAQVMTALEAIPDAMEREVALIEWDYATQFLRTHPLIPSIGAVLNLTDEQIDQFWTLAATL